MSFQRKRAAAIGTKASYPGFIEPALATSVDSGQSGKRRLQTKFDGYRVQVHLRDAVVKGFTETAYLYALRTASQEPCQHQCVRRNRARRGFSIHHSQPVTLTQSFRCGDEVLTIEDFHNPLQGQVRTFRITWLDVFCRDLLDLGESFENQLLIFCSSRERLW